MKMLSILGLIFIPLMAQAGVKLSSLELRPAGTNGAFVVGLAGYSSQQPDLQINGQVIELTIPDAEQFTALDKKRTLINKLDTSLTAENKNGAAVIRVTLPYSLQGQTDSVALTWKNNNIEVVFPKLGKATAVAPKAIARIAKTTIPVPAAAFKINKDSLNEDYLNQLVKEQNAIKAAQAEKIENNAPAVAVVAPAKAEDTITAKQASIIRETHKREPLPGAPAASNGNEFSFAGYALKFTVFLALVLGLFYGIVQVMKRGVFKRGKLGFMNNTQMIEVLSTTYVAPKRSLMVVKAHKQIFLVSNSETGLQFLSEITDTTGILKQAEKHIAGSNFDSDFDASETGYGDAKIKIKENIMESTPVKDPTTALSKVSEATKDIVKFSDELKKKAKKLKPLEFN